MNEGNFNVVNSTNNVISRKRNIEIYLIDDVIKYNINNRQFNTLNGHKTAIM